MIFDEPDTTFFVVRFGLRPPNFSIDANSGFTLASDTASDFLGRLLFQGDDWEMPTVSESSTLTEIHARMVTCMYFALTTLATVGYGDYFPSSTAEKILGSIVQVLGVSFFSVLMDGFIKVALSMKGQDGFGEKEFKL